MNVPILDLKSQYASIKSEIRAALDRVLEHGAYTLGPEVETLEKALSSYCKVPFALGTSNGTDSLLLAMMAIDLQPGDEVITSSFSFFATCETISMLRAKPVFVDVDPKTFCLDVKQIEKVITPKTKAIIPVHIFGQCADMDPLLEIAASRNLIVIEDACQAIGAKYKEKMACSMGDFTAMSFYPSKNLGTYGDGGMLFVKKENHFTVARELRTHGEYPKTYQPKRIGMNARLGAMEAAVLNVKLKYLETWNQQRRTAAQYYYELLEDSGLFKHIMAPHVPSYNHHVYHLFVILSQHKKALSQYLGTQGIQTGNHFPIPLPLLDCYKALGYRSGDFPAAEKICAESIAIPIYPEITREQQEFVVSKIRIFYNDKV